MKIDEAWSLYTSSKNFTRKNLRSENSRFNLYLYPYWINIDLETIKSRDVVLFRVYLENQNLSPQSVKLVLSLLRTILRRLSYLEYYNNKIPVFEMPKFDNRRIRYLTTDEASQLLTELHIRSELWHDISLFALNTGLRASEIFSIERNSINFSNQTIVLFDTKNTSSRIVPLNKTSLSIAYKYASYKYHFLFSNNKINEVSKTFSRAVKAIKLNEYTSDRRNKIVFHSLRHTFASWLVQSGVDIPVVQNLLGHKSLNMTMRYAHIAPTQGKNAVELLPNNISPLGLSSIKS